MSEAGTPDPEYVKARRVLLDALEALAPHGGALVLVGAQLEAGERPGERPRAYTAAVGIRERVDEMRAAVLRAADLHGARNVRVIGSVARGEAGPDSDLDLLVELDKGRSLLDHAALVIELEALLGCKVDVATEQGLRPRVRERVLAEAVPL